MSGGLDRVVQLARGVARHQPHRDRPLPEPLALQAYLLGTLPVADAAALQRRLAYDVGGDPGTAAVVLCDHPPGLTIGRHGSRADVRLTDEELAARRCPVRWLAAGGGLMLHAPGQVACYPVLPLAAVGLTPTGYVAELCRLVGDVVASFGVTPQVCPGEPAVRVAGRRVAHVGVAVRNGVTAGGVVLNVHPDLPLFRGLRCDGDPRPMTSLQRESPQRVRPAAVRQRLLEALERRYAARLSVFHHHPSLPARPVRYASTAGTR